MKIRMEILILSASFMLGWMAVHAGDCNRPAGADSAAVVKAVLETYAQMTKAAQSPDAEKMFEWILDAGPGTIIQNGVFMKSRQDALDAVKRGMLNVVKVERVFNQTRVTVLAPDAALLTGEGTTSITLDDGRTFGSPFSLTEVFVLRDGQWKVLHGHHSVPNTR